jgi:hypothetical protein
MHYYCVKNYFYFNFLHRLFVVAFIALIAVEMKSSNLLPASYWFVACLNLKPLRRRGYVPLNRWLTFYGLHGG